MTNDSSDQAQLPEHLVGYLQSCERQRQHAVHRVLDGLEPREALLVREAAVMGYVQGTRAPVGAPIPGDDAVIFATLDACLEMPDLYPTFAPLAANPSPPHPHEVAARVAYHVHVPRCVTCHGRVQGCTCVGARLWVCSTCVAGDVGDVSREPQRWPCPTLTTHGRWALCGADLEQPDGAAVQCPGVLVFRDRDTQARCLQCGAWCGAQVALYVTA